MTPPHLVHVFPSFEAGGAQLRVANIINYLDGRMRHTIIALNGNLGASYRIKPGLAGFHAGLPQRDFIRNLAGLRRTILGLLPDLVLTYNWGSIDAVLALLPGRPRPLIHNECGFSGPDELRKRRRLWARRFALNRIHKTLVTSRTMLAIARKEFGIRERRLQFIQTGVDTGVFQPGRNPALREELGVRENELLVGSVGGLRAEKGLDLILRAFAGAGLSGARLVLFGTGPELSRLQEFARESGIAGRVIFAGHREDSAACFRALDVFAMSSLTEQTPNALLEAMASGLPAICTAAGDTSHLLGEEQAAWVLPTRDPALYSQRLRELGEDARLRNRLGMHNRARCMDLFPMKLMLEEYAHAYQEAVG